MTMFVPEQERPVDLKDNERALPARFWIYQRERFPLQQYLPIVAAFTFSASGYSIMSGGRTGLIGWWVMAAGIATSFGLFFLLRLFFSTSSRTPKTTRSTVRTAPCRAGSSPSASCALSSSA